MKYTNSHNVLGRMGARLMLSAAAATIGMAVGEDARANIDMQIEARLEKIRQVLDRLEFDTNRIAMPPDYQQAIDMFTGSLCGAATAQLDLTFTPFSNSSEIHVEVEGELPVIPPMFSESEGKISGNVDAAASLGASTGVTYRLCINPVPWAMYLYYQTVAQLDPQAAFPGVVPKEVYVADDPVDGGSADGDDTGFAGEALGFSSDSVAFLEEVADQVFQGLDEAATGVGDLPWISAQIEGASGAYGMPVSTLAQGPAGVADAFGLDEIEPRDPLGSVGALLESTWQLPSNLADALPVVTDLSWGQGGFLGIDSIDDVNLCGAWQARGQATGLTAVDTGLAHVCDVAGYVEEGALTVYGSITDFADFVVNDAGEDIGKAVNYLDKMTARSDSKFIEDIGGAGIYQFFTKYVKYIGGTIYTVSLDIHEWIKDIDDL